MSQNQLIKSQSKKIIVIRKDRSSSVASSVNSKPSSIIKDNPIRRINYKNQSQSREHSQPYNISKNNQDQFLQKSDSHLLNNQLSHIQNQILDLRLQITRQISQKYELQTRLSQILEQQQTFMLMIQSQITKNNLQNYDYKSIESNSSQDAIQKFSGINYNQLASKIIFLSKSSKINEQTVKSQQNYISGLKDQNASLRKKVNKLINQTVQSKNNMESQTQITDGQDLSISIINHYSLNEKQIAKKINMQVQTDQKRIGLAQTIQKVRSNSKLNHNNLSYPYRHYLVTPENKSKITISKQRKYQNVEGTAKKINLQSIKDKRLNQNSQKDKKKIIASTPYLNHLLLESKQLTIQETLTNSGNQQTRLNIRLQNPKSQLSYRRPIHRSRSHSQQQIPSSSEKSRSNYSSSRILSGYAINPLDKYGQKRLCNEVNGKKVRKISRLSQQSQQLQQRLKQLEQEQKKLQQKYNILSEMKLVKSVTVNRSRSKCSPIN